MGDKLRIEVVLAAAVGKAQAAFRSTSGEARKLSKAISENRRVLKELGAQRTQIDAFKQTKEAAVQLAGRLKTNHQELAKLRAQAAAAQAPSAELARRIAALDKETAKLSTQYGGMRGKLNEQRAGLQRAGISARDLAAGQSRLNERTRAASEAIERQRAQLERLNAAQRRAADAAATLQKRQALAANVSIGGYAAARVGKAIIGAAHPAIDEAKQFQNEETRVRSLGLGEAASQDAIKYAKAMKSYGVSTTENLTLMRDAITVFADEHHAEMVMPLLQKMKFANKALYGEQGGADHDKPFMDMLKVIELRGGLKSREEFEKQANMVQKVLTATGGRVGADEWLQVIKTGGLAAKGLDSKAFYNQLEPLVQEMGGASVGTGLMSLYQNLYQGKTTTRAARNMEKLGLIGDMSKVKHDKAGQVSFMDPGALKGADLFRTDQFRWMKEVLLPQLASKGITEQKDVLDAIGSIVTNRKGSALLSQMYVQMKQIEKNAKLNDHADGIEAINAKAKQTASGKQEELLAKSHDAYLKVGNIALPIYTRALEFAAKAMEKLSAFAEKHPALMGAIIKVALVLGGLLSVLGAIAISVGAVLGPFALASHVMTKFSGDASFASRMFGRVGPVLGMVSRGVTMLGGAFLRAGAMMLATPIGWIVAGIVAIAVAALAIYKYWAPIKAFFSGVWSGLSETLGPVVSGLMTAFSRFGGAVLGVLRVIPGFNPLFALLGAVAGPVFDFLVRGAKDLWHWVCNLLTPVENVGSGAQDMGRKFGQVIGTIAGSLVELPTRFLEAGAQAMVGLANGISGALGMVRNAVASVGDGVVGWFKEKLGIHSPSRVFAQLGGFTMAGLEQGLTAGQGGPLQAVGTLTKQLAAAGAGVALSMPALAAPGLAVPDALSNDSFAAQLDTRPALAPQAPTAAAGMQIGSVTINVTAAPGMDTEALAREVRRQLEQLPRAGGYNASLRDRD